MKKCFRILFFWLCWRGHPLSQLIIYQKKRQNFHDKAAVTATTQIEKSTPEWRLWFVPGRLWTCYMWAGQWQFCTPSVCHVFPISVSMCIYAAPSHCLGSTLLFLTPPTLPINQMDPLNKSLFTPAQYKSRAWVLTGGGHYPSQYLTSGGC